MGACARPPARRDQPVAGVLESRAWPEWASRRPAGSQGSELLVDVDSGICRYHRHIREDYNEEMGLYGSVVVPSDPDYRPAVHRELALAFDDVLIEDDQIAAFSRDETTCSAMGLIAEAAPTGLACPMHPTSRARPPTAARSAA